VGDPVVRGDRIVVSAGQHLLAFDTAGRTAWSVDYGAAATAADPTIVGNAVWAGSLGGAGAGSIDRFDLVNGAVLSSISSVAAVGSSAATDHYVYHHFASGSYNGWGALSLDGGGSFISTSGITGSPTVGGGHVFAEGLGGKLFGGFDASGATCPVEPHAMVKLCTAAWTATIGGSLSTAAYTPDALFVGASDHRLYAFAPGGCGAPTCSALWSGETGGAVLSSPAVADGAVYVGSSDGKLYAFPAAGCGSATCSPLWTMATSGAIASSAAVANGVVYIGSDDGRLYAADAHGCAKPTCAALWMSEKGAAVRSSPAVAAGSVYVGRDDGTLVAYRAAGGSSPR
jgi:outer membrane protein assembly factor BamB